MRYVDTLDINIYHIRLFLEVAETKNITHAANNMHITQSMLSKTIKNLEITLGIQLFVREKNKLKITPAGLVLYDEFSKIHRSMEKAIKKAHMMQEAKEIPVTISYVNTYNPYSFVFPSIEHYKKRFDRFQYHLENCSFAESRQQLLAGNVDVVFTSLFDRNSYEESLFCCEQVLSCPMMVFMLPFNSLAQKARIEYGDLREQNFVIISPAYSPEYINQVIGPYAANAGFKPNISYHASNERSISDNLHLDNEIFIADRFFVDYCEGRFVKKNIENTESGIILVWKKDANAIVHDFCETTVDFLKNRYDDLA